jgi:hypothetical protein
VIYRTRSQLLEKRQVFLRIFTRRKVHTVFVSQFLLAEAEERAKGWIHEEGLTFQILNCNPDGTRIENILEKLNISDGWCYVFHRASSSAQFPFPEYIALPISKHKEAY